MPLTTEILCSQWDGPEGCTDVEGYGPEGSVRFGVSDALTSFKVTMHHVDGESELYRTAYAYGDFRNQ